jgi:hypothetical protein
VWQKLFENRERLFWTLHTGGWLGFALFYYIGSFLNDMRDIWVFVILLNAYAGWLMTIPLRYVYRHVWQFAPWKMLVVTLGASYVVAVFWAVIKNFNYWEVYKHGYRPEDWYMYFGNTTNSFIMVIAWTGLYFGMAMFP